jgi:triacylglycerol lipase
VDQLTDRIMEDVLAATGAGKVLLVGHGLGALIIALALTRDRLAGHVDQVVALGSPFSGSPWAGMLPLRPSSGAPVGLTATATPDRSPAPVGVRWLAFASVLGAIVPAHRAVAPRGRCRPRRYRRRPT